MSAAIDYLLAQGPEGILVLFWFVILFEIPRYFLGFLMVILTRKPVATQGEFDGTISVVVAGHSEEKSIEKCVRALHEQSRPPDEIIVVSDGSTDKMAIEAGLLLRAGLIDQIHSTDLRSGKSAGINLAHRWQNSDIVVNVDCDCSFDRHAIRNICRPFRDPKTAAVCGNISVRNESRSLATAFQSIEYAVTISLSKQAADRLDQVSCISGAFGAFRSDVFERLGGLSSGGGEDLDLTMRLRQQGEKVRFAADAVCFTDVPHTFQALFRQRFRWERDAIRLRFRKHADLLNPFSPRFRTSELFNEFEYLFFNVFAAAALPFYLIWLFGLYGSFGVSVLLAAQMGLFVLEIATLCLALYVTPHCNGRQAFLFLPGYSVFNGFVMRFVRLAAYAQEWIFKASYHDPYVPNKVHKVRG